MRPFLILPLLLTLPLFALLAGIFAGPADAGVICGRYDSLAKLLTSRFDEHAVASGLPNEGRSYLEIWASEAGTWSVLVVAPKGPTCLIHSGEDFELLKRPKSGRSS